MENGWTKCGVKLPCSSSRVSSSSEQFLLEARNQMNMNISHCIPPRDARELGPLSPQLKQATTSNILNFSSCKPIHPESGSTYHYQLSAPPSVLESDFQRQSNVRPFNAACPPDTSALGNVGTMPNWPLLQNLSNFNAKAGVDARPISHSGTIMNANNANSRAVRDDVDTLRAFISQAANSSSTLLDASLRTPSSVSKKKSLVASGCPRVFCMGASGDLLLSSTGLFGILCSCHGIHMSVSKFCEHSGLFDVNPGDAVRIDSGESIAQWRKVYLQKFGIRAPGDHRGWDWPEGLLANSGLGNSSTAVADRRKVFDLSSLFNSSAESSTQLRNNVSSSRPRPTQEYSSQVIKNVPCENNDHSNMGSFRKNLHNTTDTPEIACSTLKSFRSPLPCENEGSENGCQLKSFHFMPSRDNSLSSAFQNLQSVVSKVNTNSTDDVLQRGTISSSVELKLGQPCQLSWGSGSAVLSGVRPHTNGVQATTVHEKLNCNLENAKITDETKQLNFCHSASDFSKTKKSYAAGSLINAQTQVHAGPLGITSTSTYGTTHVEHSKDGLHSSFANSGLVPPSYTTAGGSSYQKDTSKRMTESHPFSPWTLNHQHRVDRSVVIDFSCNRDAPIRPSNSNGSLNKKSRTIGATCGHKDSKVGSVLSSNFHAKQMDISGSTITGRTCSPNSSALPAATSSLLGMTNVLSDVSGASNNIGNAYNTASNLGRDQFPSKLKNSSFIFRSTPTLQATSAGITSATDVLTPGPSSASFNKDCEAVNSYASDESMRLLALRNADKSFNEKINASLEFNQRTRIQSEQRQQSKSFSNSDMRDQGLLLDQRHFGGQWNRRTFSAAQTVSPSVPPGAGHKKGMNLGAVSEEMSLHSELTDKYNEASCNPQQKQLSSLSCRRLENMEWGCNMVQRYNGGSSFHISDRCNSNVQTVCSNMELDCDGSNSLYGLKKQPISAVVDTPMNDRFSNNVSTGKGNLAECSQSGKEQLLKSDCGNSRWIDVPSKATTVSKLRCPNAPTCNTDTRENPEGNLKEHAIKATPKMNEEAGLLERKELSDISSECSAPAVTQASNEVMKNSVVDASHTIYDTSQIADQGSAISRSCSSVEAIDSFKNSQLSNDGKARSTEEESLTVLENAAHHSGINEFLQTYPISNAVQNLAVSGGSSGEDYMKTQNEGAFTSRKRKRTIKSKTLGTPSTVPEFSFLSSDFQACAGGSVNHHAPSEDVQVLNVNSSYNNFKRRRSSLFSVKKLISHNRNRNEIDDVESALNEQVPLKGNDNSIDLPESAAIRKLKQVKPAKAIEKLVKATEAVEGYWLNNPLSEMGSLRVKPVACGKYGIICAQELDIDQLKPPKIVPLSQVLKASKRRAKFEKAVAVPSRRKKKTSNHGGKKPHVSCGNNRLQVKQYNKFLHSHSQVIDTPQATQHTFLDKTHSDDPAVSVEDGADGDERNLGVSTSHQTALSKGKEIRMRSIYELSSRGNELIPADISCSQHVMCAPPTVCGLEMITPKDAGRSNGCQSRAVGKRSFRKLHCSSSVLETDKLCCVCGISNKDNANCLLECGNCLIQIHQACYGITRVPKGEWYCRPCRTSSKDVACVLCGYGGGAMTRAFGSRNVVKSLLKAWDIRTEPNMMIVGSAEALYVPAKMECQNYMESATFELCPSIKPVVHNSIVSGLFDPTVKQWVHMVCGLWTPGTRCPNVDTMSAFDVSGVPPLNNHMVCYICNRTGGSCIRCRVETCYTHFHPWCAHHKGLLQSEVEGVNNDEVGFYGRCLVHANPQASHSENDKDTGQATYETEQDKEPTCARTEGYQGKKHRDLGNYSSYQHSGKSGCLVTQVQLDAWLYINKHKLRWDKQPKSPVSDVDHDYRKEYARYKQAKGWKHLVVYKSGIHALGLYTSHYIQRGAMVVEYVGEIVGHRVADKRETEYLTGRKLQYKSACYFFRIDKEQIIDATCKGGIARFVNHSCQPNCVAKVLTVRGDKKVVFFAQRDIYPGEEITYDYHFNHEDEGKKIPCFCNSKNCRRYLN